jgi:beta-glucanase (GH16 family)
MKYLILAITNKRGNISFGKVTDLKRFISSSIRMVFLSMMLVIPFFAQCQTKPGDKPAQVKKLIWSDEFNYIGAPDPAKWDFEVGFLKYNNEPQYYTKDLKNARVANGNLIITAIKEDLGGAKYTSARMITKGKFEFTGGRVEVRAKLPKGRGVWPAIWTLGANIDKVGWPACGEIDIMEYWGHNPSTVASNVHTRDYNHRKGNGRGGKIVFEEPWKDFHIYAVEWYSDRLDFFFDNTMFYSCKSKGEGIGEWPFVAPQYLLINLALVGGQPGIDDSILPQEFIVDYARVYELK